MAFVTKKHLSRRTLLRSAGAALALPLLDSMIPARTPLARTAAKPALRAGFVYIPNGAIVDRWVPAGNGGADFAFSPILKPLEPFRQHINIVSGLSLPLGAPSAHAQSSGMWLNSARLRGMELKCDTTADQHIAGRIGQDSRLPSLELATEDVSGAVGACEGGIDCTFLNTLCWRTPLSPLPMEINPRVIFERLFGDGSTPAERLSREEESASILDHALAGMKSLETGLGPADRVKLNEYFEDVREIERRIQMAGKQNDSRIKVPNQPIGVPENFEEHINLMFDLMALAWQADISRVSTFMVARELSGMTYPQIGVRDPHHAISHHQHNPELMDKLTKINTYHASLFARYLEKLRSTPDGDGTLLDHAMILYGGGMSDSNVHSHDLLPLLVAGGGAGTIKGNRHIKVADHSHMSNLLVSMMEKADVHEEKFGDSNGKVDL
jgi:Protein of unknown function (DUF1552)